jgi:hypothetical protein
MGNLYTTTTAVRGELPADPGTTVLPEAAVAVYITDRSRYVDDSLPNYAPFAGVTGTPATPRTIERITRFLAAYDCYVRLGIVREDGGVRKVLEEQAERQLADLREGRLVLNPAECSYTGSSAKERIKGASDAFYYPLYSADLKREDD